MFNCPANLASHRRWHKPRQGSISQKNVLTGALKLKQKSSIRPNENANNDCQVGNFVCKDCGKSFRRLVNQSMKSSFVFFEKTTFNNNFNGFVTIFIWLWSFRMAYLKKHAIVHQYSICEMEKRLSLLEYNKLISNRNGAHVAAAAAAAAATSFKTMLPDAEQRHLHQIREFYYQQQECLSAFQYVQHHRFEKNNKR